MPWAALASIQPPAPADEAADGHRRGIERGFEHLERALAMGADLCCLPEFFNVFGVPTLEMRETAANAEEVLARLQDLAGRHAAHIAVGLLVEQERRFFDRAYLLDAGGAIAATYDKVHLTVGERDQLDLVAGTGPVVVQTPLGRLALTICYDIYFPVYFAALTRLRPDVILLPSLQRSEHEMASDALVKVRAMDATAYLMRSSYGRQLDLSWKPGMMFGQ
jgi:predicted amidohydrolase